MWYFTWPPVERFVLDYINPLGRLKTGCRSICSPWFLDENCRLLLLTLEAF